jgi:hypothetical protein
MDLEVVARAASYGVMFFREHRAASLSVLLEEFSFDA